MPNQPKVMSSDLKPFEDLEKIATDIFLHGQSFIEMVKDSNGRVVQVARVDPTTIYKAAGRTEYEYVQVINERPVQAFRYGEIIKVGP